jgi:predicted dehydrogenase
MTENGKLRLAVVGTGAISQIVHLPVLAGRPDVEFIALADRDSHKAQTVARRFDVPAVLDPDDVMGREDVDAVVICTPPASHEELAVAALEAGKHVFVERPVAMTCQGVERVLAAAQEAGRRVSVGLPHRYRPDVAALKSFVAGGDLGAPYAVKGSWLIRPVPVNRPTWRQDRGQGGGALMELAVPAIDLCLWVIGYPSVDRLTCHLAVAGEEVEHGASVLMRTHGGVTVTVEVASRYFSGADRQYVRVLGSEGAGELPPLEVYKQLGGRPLEMTPRQPRPQGGENPYMNAYRRGLDSFIRGLSGVGESNLPTEQVELMRVVDAAYRSAAEGTEVTL